ncbi:hypothetical protein [Leptospira mayottensis]|uniref:Uncharacterized protein n=1 Tax=Leptospira mayottensis 200901122 TaxID=1193010 RepID=A0AA87SZ19_9LEPT|nr:hypothetical protein [Leptospira mayottensis]EKS02047.1 hypothetical protein LEP1GSC125_0926 [Leptospira mayottensis 200901122]
MKRTPVISVELRIVDGKPLCKFSNCPPQWISIPSGILIFSATNSLASVAKGPFLLGWALMNSKEELKLLLFDLLLCE